MEHIVKVTEDKGAVNIFNINKNETASKKGNPVDLSCGLLLKNLIKTNVKLLKMNDLRSIVLL